MENYIVINGKKAELTEEQLKQLGIEVKKANPYERQKTFVYYYLVSEGNNIIGNIEKLGLKDEHDFKNANYCADKEMARQDMLHDLLNRKLRQFSNLNGGIDLNSDINKDVWENVLTKKYYIYCDCAEDKLRISNNSLVKISNTTYFTSEEIAKRAIKEVVKPFMEEHKEFVW